MRPAPCLFAAGFAERAQWNPELTLAKAELRETEVGFKVRLRFAAPGAEKRDRDRRSYWQLIPGMEVSLIRSISRLPSMPFNEA